MMVFVDTLIATYLIGLLTFFTMADWNDTRWENAFFAWQRVSETGLLAWIALYAVGNKLVRSRVKWVLILSVLQLCWEAYSQQSGINVNNSVAVMVAFCCCITVVILLTFWRQNRLNKWLDRKLP
jgi:hypothetical protein